MPNAGPTILVTGANGFAGRHLIRHLLETDPAVRIVAGVHRTANVAPSAGETRMYNPEMLPWPGSVEIEAMDVTDYASTEALILRVRPTQIYHLAARASGADPDRNAVFAVNVQGTRNTLIASVKLSHPPKVLVISSGYVYGNTDASRPARESDAIGPVGRYGVYTDSKIEVERIAAEYPETVLVARAFAHTGPEQAADYAIPAFARQITRIEQGLEPPVIRVGNLSAMRDLLDVRDVVRGYRALMECALPGGVYNIASGTPYSISSVLDRLRSLSHRNTEVEVDPARLRPADIRCSTGDPTRALEATGWSPTIGVDTTLADTLEYWRAR